MQCFVALLSSKLGRDINGWNLIADSSSIHDWKFTKFQWFLGFLLEHKTETHQIFLVPIPNGEFRDERGAFSAGIL